MARSANNVMKAVVAIVGAVVGLVVVNDVIQSEVGDPVEDDVVIDENSIAGTVVEYIVPIIALVVLASAVAIYRLS